MSIPSGKLPTGIDLNINISNGRFRASPETSSAAATFYARHHSTSCQNLCRPTRFVLTSEFVWTRCKQKRRPGRPPKFMREERRRAVGLRLIELLFYCITLITGSQAEDGGQVTEDGGRRTSDGGRTTGDGKYAVISMRCSVFRGRMARGRWQTVESKW